MAFRVLGQAVVRIIMLIVTLGQIVRLSNVDLEIRIEKDVDVIHHSCRRRAGRGPAAGGESTDPLSAPQS